MFFFEEDFVLFINDFKDKLFLIFYVKVIVLWCFSKMLLFKRCKYEKNCIIVIFLNLFEVFWI